MRISRLTIAKPMNAAPSKSARQENVAPGLAYSASPDPSNSGAMVVPGRQRTIMRLPAAERGKIGGETTSHGAHVFFGCFYARNTLCGCGYHVAWALNALPKSIHVIAVPAIENKTSSYRIEQRLTAATIHEFLAIQITKLFPLPRKRRRRSAWQSPQRKAVPLLFTTINATATTPSTTRATTHACHHEVARHAHEVTRRASLPHGQLPVSQ